MKVLFLLLIILAAIAIPANIHMEKKAYNRGFCRNCGGRLKLFDMDSQGGRGYWCSECNYHTWVSYHCVDKF